MRARYRILTATFALALLGGLPVVAQEDDSAPVTFVTGTVTEMYGYEVDGEQESDLRTRDVRGYEVMTQSGGPMRQVVEWSDPRLSSDLWLSAGYTLISAGEDEPAGAMNVAWQSLSEDEEGRWHGTGRAVQGADQKYSLYALTGEGAYEGLSALLRGVTPSDEEAGLLHAHAPWDMAYEGYIFEAGLTSLPDEPALLAAGEHQLWPVPAE